MAITSVQTWNLQPGLESVHNVLTWQSFLQWQCFRSRPFIAASIASIQLLRKVFRVHNCLQFWTNFCRVNTHKTVDVWVQCIFYLHLLKVPPFCTSTPIWTQELRKTAHGRQVWRLRLRLDGIQAKWDTKWSFIGESETLRVSRKLRLKLSYMGISII